MNTAQLVLFGVLAVFAVVGYFVWDRRYRGAEAGAFQATGKLTRVYEDPETGLRQYREEG